MVDYIITSVIATLVIVLVLYLLAGIRIIRPTHRGLVETMGKYNPAVGFRVPGFNFIWPIFQRMIYVNVTERMSDIEPQEIITKDNLNAKVDLVVFYRIKPDKENVARSVYEVNNVDTQLETISRTTARNVIGTLPFRDVNSERNELNKRLQEILVKETKNWGVEVLKVELKDIVPPRDVQDTMNKVIKAENEKQAAVDLATAAETTADGKRRASIKEAEGVAKGRMIVADGEAYRIKTVNEAAKKYFVGPAQLMKKLEVTQASLENNTKVVLTEKGINPSIILGDIPFKDKSKQ